MSWIIITSIVIAAWALLSILGGERQRQLVHLQREAAHAAHAAESAKKASA